MKISELSRRSGVPLPTIKFYLREGLLQAGERMGPNQADYGPEHESRLRLIRLMREVGGLSIATIREIVELMERAEDRSVVAQVADAIADQPGPQIAPTMTQHAGRAQASEEVQAMLERLGWKVRAGSRVRERLVDALVALRATIEPDLPVDVLVWYAEFALKLASKERTEGVRRLDPGLEGVVQGIVAGTILWEMVFTTLRRLAHEHLAADERYDDWLATWFEGESRRHTAQGEQAH